MFRRSVQVSWVRCTLQHRVLSGCRPVGRRGFSFYTETVLWRWRTSANVPEDRSGWPERQRWNFVCRVPLLFSARTDLHVRLTSGVFTTGPLGPCPSRWDVDRKCSKSKISHTAVIGLEITSRPIELMIHLRARKLSHIIPLSCGGLIP